MLVPKLVRITGSHGRWVANVEGHFLAVLHSTFWTPPNDYFAPSDRAHKPGSNDYLSFVKALETYDLVVMQKDADPNTLSNAGYLAVFCFSKLKFHPTGIGLSIIKRYADRRR